MTTHRARTELTEDAAPVHPEDAADTAYAEAAASDGPSDQAPIEGDDATESDGVVPAARRPTPAGASAITDTLRAARADQRMANGTHDTGATAPVVTAALTQPADSAHSSLILGTMTPPALAETPAPDATPDPAVSPSDAAAPAAEIAAAPAPDVAPPDAAPSDAAEIAVVPDPALDTTLSPDAPVVAEPTTYEDLIARMDAPHRQMVDAHLSGLKAALQAERANVTRLTTQAKATQAEADEQARQNATERDRIATDAAALLATREADAAALLSTRDAEVAAARADVAVAQRRADFYESAVDQGVRRTSVRLAYLAALDANHLHADGTIGWAEFRSQFSDLFESPRSSPIPPSRSSSAAAGAGARSETPAVPTLNQIIRNAAGRR